MTIYMSYVDTLCRTEKDQDETSLGGEDSSYDSDYETEESKSHQDVSRTVSDTLGAEFAEYVSGVNSSSYQDKVEFGLKLGYTEKLVQAALCKLGPNPSHNELLAELIKLGAQAPKPPDFDSDDAGEEASVEETGVRLRPIVIDGSNVAMSHGNKEVFSCRGIKICVDWFKSRGHKEITVFVPKWRKEASRPDNPITDQEILSELEKERIVVFTPSRLVGGRRTICYDDRYVLRLAVEVDGIVVSNDNYRDLAQESAEFRKVVEERTLMYSFVNDRFMPPDDPLGRSGPTLDNFLKMQTKRGDSAPPCPYKKKCTYGNKCKYHHPERGPFSHKSVTERLVGHAQKHLQARGSRDSSPGGNQLKGKSLSVPLSSDDQSRQHGVIRKTPLSRTKSGAPGCPTAPAASSDSDKVSKSKSVENILNESRSKVVNPGQPNPYWRQMSSQEWQYPQVMDSAHSVVGQRLSDPESAEGDVVRLHRKLERQLSLNPYDPTVYEMGRMYMPVERQIWEHQNVHRIASAPDSYRSVPPQPAAQRHMHRLSSTSDPQINLRVPDPAGAMPDPFESHQWVPAQAPVVYTPPGHVQLPAIPPQSHLQFASYSKEEARRKIHYHLASIFPEDQVLAALQLYPDETKPQQICAAILAMFHKF
ncbi:UNVERIFIED_CONTAM: hypothetical protein PYX00_003128 [Menopon gallinae]|uniref:C3H1-type domain-containing protein n=1 Tax=Menopon gallinae TaxID=328185 RepID=A0AAW2I094_9NEOP